MNDYSLFELEHMLSRNQGCENRVAAGGFAVKDRAFSGIEAAKDF
jgi:hypothetical protein